MTMLFKHVSAIDGKEVKLILEYYIASKVVSIVIDSLKLINFFIKTYRDDII